MTTCKHCSNTIWTEDFISGEWVKVCTNCSHTRKAIKRKPKGCWVTEGELNGKHVYLTSNGWKTFDELKSKSDMCYYRKTAKLENILVTSFEVANINTTYIPA